MNPRVRRALGVLVGLGALASGCGDDAEQVEAATVADAAADFLPASLRGLRVEREALPERLASTTRSYLDSMGLYSLREGEELAATMQVGRFSDDARVEDSEFRRDIVNQLGSSQPRAFRMGDQVVHLTTGDQQRVAVWFEDRFLLILAVRDDFEGFRGLLRDTVELAK